MSYQKKDHTLSNDLSAFIEKKLGESVSKILRQEHGHRPSPVKNISKKTHISPATIKKWYIGQNPPRLAHFVILARHYPSILQALLEAIGGTDLWEGYVALGDKLRFTYDDHASEKTHIYSAENCPINLPLPLEIERTLNPRQRWFLEQLHMSRAVKGEDIAKEWHVCVRTTKSDIAYLIKINLVRFIGSKKSGRYCLLVTS